MAVFGSVFSKEKPRVFLGTLAVAPREDLKRKIDQWGMFQTEDLDTSLRHNLEAIFSLPDAREVHDPKDNDYVIDVIVPRFQSGDAWGLDLGEFGIPLMWRPAITVSARLYSLKSGKTKAIFSVTEKMKVRDYVRRLLTWRAFLRFRPVFDKSNMEYLLYSACHRLLVNVTKKI